MRQTVSFDVGPEEFDIIVEVVERAEAMLEDYGEEPRDRTTMLMDISATHANGCPLHLKRLLEASDYDFAHDFFGIQSHIDRTTGQLTDCFLPRAARTGE